MRIGVDAGAGFNVCYTALSSAKQKSATAHCYRAFRHNPCKGGVTNIRTCTSVRTRTPKRLRIEVSFVIA